MGLILTVRNPASPPAEHRLGDGDVLRIGDCEILVSFDETKTAAPSSAPAALGAEGGDPAAMLDTLADLAGTDRAAMLSAVADALRATLDHFSPGSIRRRRGHDLGLFAKILPALRDAALWRRYEAEFVAAKKESDEAFLEVFARELRKARERELRG